MLQRLAVALFEIVDSLSIFKLRETVEVSGRREAGKLFCRATLAI